MKYPAFVLEAVQHKDLASVTKVFNVAEISYTLHVHICPKINNMYSLYEVDEIIDGAACPVSLDWIRHQPHRPWYDFVFQALSQSPGHHMYRLSLVNKSTDDTCYLYFAYVMQDDNPDKPYIYMKR